MEAAQSAVDVAISGGSSAGAGGPAPFLLKTYDMIDDSATDDIVSWSSSKSSFVVWNPPEFSSRLLPTYFKHNNFSSFIRQLNTYGFRKIDPERWEFANDEFLQGQKHLLKNIHRRKPIHSHSTPPFGGADGERSALEDEIDRLQREKSALHADLWRFKNQQSGAKIQLEDLDRRQRDMEQRQARMIAFLHRAVQNPKFVENLITMAGSSSSALHKKRRFPVVEFCEVVENNNNNSNSNSFSEDSCSNSKPAAEVGGHVFSQDFCDKLKLELSPAFSDSNLVCPSNQDSNDGGDRCLRAAAQIDDSCHIRMECLQFVPDALELSDTGASFCPKRNSLVADSFGDGDGDGDELPSFHLNLTLASSSSIQINNSNNNNNNLSTIPSSIDLCATNGNIGNDCRKNGDLELTDAVAVSMSEVSKGEKQAQPVVATARVNDKFWEQFLTERPGSSDTEEASSSLRDDLCEEQQEDRNTIEDMEHLTL